MFFGFLTCLDSFLYSFTVLPLRFLVVLATQLRFFLRRKRGSLPISQKIDLIKSVVLLMTVYLLSSLNASILYHNIRGQSAVKLYVMFNVLEIGDKLFCSFGQDVLAVLLSSRTLNGAIWKMYLFGTIAVCYNLLHSAALFCQMITLNVAVNSYSNALLTLLLSNQFGEIKSTVFKKFERENLFQLTCADIAERFQLWTMLLMIGLRNIVEVSGSTGGVIPQSWKGWNTFMGALFGPAVVVLGSEIAVDWLKHSYIAKFNKLRPKVYSRFLTVFCVDQVNNADLKNTNKTWGRKEMNVTRRIGVPILPLTCVFIKSTVQVMQLVASTRPLSLPTRTTTHSPSVMGGEANNTAASMLPGSLLDMVSKSVGSTIEIGAYTGMLLLLFSALVFVKLVLGAVLLEYSKRRLEKQQSKTPTTQLSSDTDPFSDERVSGERKGGVWGLVDLSDGLRELVSEHDEDDSVPSTPISPVSAVPSAASSIYEGHTTNQKKHVSLQEVERFQMVAKRIW
ncbi:eukaryotic membrane protein family-domain-containing protein [Myxozyma melibiosi]|uniref:Eukaryotic membrane protein family-domain-containing protein n=1 Tax=Myxozyma melibiosi TaxID=54550 RepID=A0ABR1F2I0_9ASCO